MTVDHVEGMFRNVFGLGESAARVAAAGRGEPAGFDRVMRTCFVGLGCLSLRRCGLLLAGI
jgi:hypothetical protein